MKTERIKEEIKKSYANIAKGNSQESSCSAASGCCTTDEFGTSMSENYADVDGYEQDSDLSLGCGLPTETANIHEGDTVVDLGSGAGNDAFIARRIVGESGKVIGVDMTPEMVERAAQNNQKLGYENVEFLLGEIESMENVPANVADVVISNCVMNLVPDKVKAFEEVHRILKAGGHFSISDIVYVGTLPKGIAEAAEMHAGCISGASEKGAYLGTIKSAGFKNMKIKKERRIELPDRLLRKYVSPKALDQFKQTDSGIYSITIYADKLDEGACCEATESGCCANEPTAAERSSDNSCCGTPSFTQDSICC